MGFFKDTPGTLPPPNACFCEDIAGLIRGFLQDKDGYLRGETVELGAVAQGNSRF